MTLSFSTVINGKPNYFIEKIWAAIKLFKLTGIESIQYHGYKTDFKEKFGNLWDGFEKFNFEEQANPKLHTIRLDQNNRWGAGYDIHFVINNRTKNRFQFAPVIKCVSVHEIKIEHHESKAIAGIILHPFASVTIDGKILRYESIKQLAINDGFDSVEDFFAYFNKDFTGKLIHWTDLKY